MNESHRTAVSRMFGSTHPGVYSTSEYISAIGPEVERMTRESKLRVANTVIEGHNRGVRLSLMLERTMFVRPSTPGTPVDEVLHEHGQERQTSHEASLAQFFEAFDKLTAITLIDSRGTDFTVRRGEAKAESKKVHPGGGLDMSAFGESAPAKVSRRDCAIRLFNAKHEGVTPNGQGYNAYLKSVIRGRDGSHVLKSENKQVAEGAAKAKRDLSRLHQSLA